MPNGKHFYLLSIIAFFVFRPVIDTSDMKGKTYIEPH